MKKAMLVGLLIATAPGVDFSFLYRNISRAFQSLCGNAFTESSSPTNEKGIYMAASVRPTNALQLDVYADIFQSTWLKYRASAPSSGTSYFLQIQYKPTRTTEIYVRFKSECKQVDDPGSTRMPRLINANTRGCRLHLETKLNPSLTTSARFESVSYNAGENNIERGYLAFADFKYKQPFKSYGASIRLALFETGGYNSRIYAYENDVQYSFSVPALFDAGIRYLLLLRYDPDQKISCWLRWAQTIYVGKTIIGSGSDEISGSHKSDFRFQILINL